MGQAALLDNARATLRQRLKTERQLAFQMIVVNTPGTWDAAYARGAHHG